MEPTDKLLDRDISAALAEPIAAVGSPTLQEVVDYAIRVFERCNQTAKGSDENIGLLFSFYGLIEMLDGAEVLLAKGAVGPATVCLRAGLEALLSQEWVARNVSSHGMAYMVSEVHRRISEIDRYDPKTHMGKQLREALEEKEMGDLDRIPELLHPEQSRESLHGLLMKPHYVAAEAEWQRTKKKLKRSKPPFFALWDGPTSLELLAKELKRAGEYYVLYGSWSRTAHAGDLHRLLRGVEGKPAVQRLRNNEGLATLYSLAITLGLAGIDAALSTYRSGELEGRGRWYFEKVQDAYLKLAKAPD